MRRGTISALLCSIAILFAFPAAAGAHRLDEYLQATRLSLGLDRIVVEIDLTPGVDVAPISEAEARAYATRMLKEIVLDVDGQHQTLTLVSSRFPSFQEMSAGIGTIRIDARAVWPGGPGRHSLSYQNNHRPDLGAYLVNALLPKNRDIEITEQHRDFLQRGIRLTFNVKSPVDRSTLPPWPLAFGLGFTVLVGFGVVSRTSVAPRLIQFGLKYVF
ncbi:MAG: hypothetical protein DMG13_12630 [Acidobacteria bacterium]|nr:MAG: hypothetical protein DMG13_12630 [Acidobacteriota bacterium]